MLYQIVEIVYLASTLWLAIFGLNALYLTLRYWGFRRRPTPKAPEVTSWPRVTIQLPLFNEKHVVTRLLEAISQIDYPRDRLDVQVLDDSTDDTTEMAACLVSKLQEEGLDIDHIRRTNREGFKAGALAYGLKSAKGEFLAVFDADFVPPPDFLHRTVPYFQDRGIGCVQTRWGFLNALASSFTRALSVAVDGHYLVEKRAQFCSGYFINFNGSAGIWRRAALETSGGWQSDTLTEDLDLSMRAQMAGWRFFYAPDVISPSELPFQIEAFRRQQFRWAKGSTQTAGKLLGKLWLSRLPVMIKFQATLQLTAYLVHPLMLFAAGLTAILSLSDSVLPRWLPLVSISALGLPFYLLTAQVGNGRPWTTRLFDVVQSLLIGAGLTPTSARSVFEAMLGINTPFLRTPKFSSEEQWVKSDYSLRIDSTVWAEAITMIVYLGTIAATYSRAYYGALSCLVLPCLGQFYLLILSTRQTRKIEEASRLAAGDPRQETGSSQAAGGALAHRNLYRESEAPAGRSVQGENKPGSASLKKRDVFSVEAPFDQE